jgi:subtilisin family serine protease
LNASVVVASQEQIAKVATLPFVEKVELVAMGFHATGQTGKKESFQAPRNLGLDSKKERSYDFQNDLLGIPAMHEEGFTGKGVMVAVFDAGFLHADKISGMAHLFEEDRIVATKDFVLPESENVFRSDGHGTASLSLMASNEKSKLISGAFQAQYILCITEDVSSEFRIEEYNWIRAAEFSDSLGVDIINSSLGYNIFDDPEMNYSKEDLDGKTAVITIGASMAAYKGILVISSAGNEGN